MNSPTPDAPSFAAAKDRVFAPKFGSSSAVGRVSQWVRYKHALRRRRIEARQHVSERQLEPRWPCVCVHVCTTTLSARFFISAMIQSPALS